MRFRVIQLVCFQHCWERGQKMLVKLMVGQKKAWEFGGVLRIIQWLLDHVPSLATSPEPQSVCLLGYASSLVPPCSPGNGWSTPVTWVCAEQQWSAPSSSPRVIAAPLDRLRPMLQRIKYTRSTLLKMRQKTENRKSYKISCPLFLSPFSMRSKVFKFNTVINMWRCHVQNNTCLDEKGHFGKKKMAVRLDGKTIEVRFKDMAGEVGANCTILSLHLKSIANWSQHLHHYFATF